MAPERTVFSDSYDRNIQRFRAVSHTRELSSAATARSPHGSPRRRARQLATAHGDNKRTTLYTNGVTNALLRLIGCRQRRDLFPRSTANKLNVSSSAPFSTW